MPDNKSRQYLELYRREYESFKVAYIVHEKIWKYIIYPSDEYDEWSGGYSEDYEAEHREIFPDEIIIETDMQSKIENKKYSIRLCKRLRLNGFSYNKYDSGNKSKHIQLFFPQLKRVYSSDKRKKIKELFVRWLVGCKRNYPSCNYCNGSKRGDEMIDCEVVTKNIDMQLFGKHMIRMEYSIHPKTLRLKTLEEEYDTGEDNILPKKTVKQFNKSFKHINYSKSHDNKNVSDMMCIHYFLNKPIDDCRARVCFTVTNNLIKSKSAQEVKDILFNWNKKILNEYLTIQQIDNNIKGALRSKQHPGCNYNKGLLRELGVLSVCKYCNYEKIMKTNQLRRLIFQK